MNFVRLVFRLPAVMLVLLFSPMVSVLGGWFVSRDEVREYHWRCKVARCTARLLLRSCGGKLTVEGKPPVTPFILVSNHLGYMDIVAMHTVVPAYYISKKEVANWPIIGALVRNLNCLFVDREDPRDLVRLNPMITELVGKGLGVVFYPEGTSTRGETILPFMPSLLESAAVNDFPVYYASISYRTEEGAEAADHAVCWWGDMEFFPHLLNLLKHKTFYATITFGRDSLRNSNRKVLAKDLRNAVLEIFTPVVNQEDLCTTR